MSAGEAQCSGMPYFSFKGLEENGRQINGITDCRDGDHGGGISDRLECK
jgi:hypothetical protein